MVLTQYSLKTVFRKPRWCCRTRPHSHTAPLFAGAPQSPRLAHQRAGPWFLRVSPGRAGRAGRLSALGQQCPGERPRLGRRKQEKETRDRRANHQKRRKRETETSRSSEEDRTRTRRPPREEAGAGKRRGHRLGAVGTNRLPPARGRPRPLRTGAAAEAPPPRHRASNRREGPAASCFLSDHHPLHPPNISSELRRTLAHHDPAAPCLRLPAHHFQSVHSPLSPVFPRSIGCQV